MPRDSIAHMVDEVGLRSDHKLTRVPLHVYEAHPRTTPYPAGEVVVYSLHFGHARARER